MSDIITIHEYPIATNQYRRLLIPSCAEEEFHRQQLEMQRKRRDFFGLNVGCGSFSGGLYMEYIVSTCINQLFGRVHMIEYG